MLFSIKLGDRMRRLTCQLGRNGVPATLPLVVGRHHQSCFPCVVSCWDGEHFRNWINGYANVGKICQFPMLVCVFVGSERQEITKEEQLGKNVKLCVDGYKTREQ